MRWWWLAAWLPGVAHAGATVQSTGTYYGTISAAITAAPTGDTLLIEGVTHVEDLVISKTLTLQGAGEGLTVIRGSSALNAISLASVGTVTLLDLTVDGLGSRAIDVQAGTLIAGRVTVAGGATFADGGAINLPGTVAQLTDVRLLFTSAARGGAVAVTSGGFLLGQDLTIQGTMASTDGGAIYAFGGTVDCTDCVFDATSTSGSGGAIRAAAGSTIALTGGRVEFPTAGGNGGFVAVDGGSSLTVTGVQVNGASAAFAGGVVFAGAGAVVDIADLHDSGSSAYASGFLHASGAAEPILIRRSLLCETGATLGDLISSDGDLTVENTVFQDVVGQAAVAVQLGHLRAFNNAILSSAVTGFDVSQGTYAITNNVFYGVDLGAQQALSTGTASYNAFHQIALANYSGLTGTFDVVGVDPQFIAYSDDGDCTNDILFPQADSPLRDAGSPAMLDDDGTWSDIGPAGGPQADPAWWVDADGDNTISWYDCDDGNAAVRPGATEVCDGFDNDCDGVTDPDGIPGGTLYYVDADGDGFGSDSDLGLLSCSFQPGRSLLGTDCDDGNDLVFPGAIEVCSDAGDDRNCDGDPDRDAIDADPWSLDGDGDGFGGVSSEDLYCQSPGADWIFGPAEDCDDQRADVFPGQTEVCDGVDQNCSGDESDAPGWVPWYVDVDLDGFGNPAGAVGSCLPVPGRVVQGGDCNDGNALTYPGAPEICDVFDNDCDGDIDNGEPIESWYRDADNDGWGDATDTQNSYCPPAVTGYVLVVGDCDDRDDTIHPDATEICDEIDNDCDGDVDLDDASLEGATVGYEDFDQDGYGTGPAITTCDPTGLASVDGDCADGIAIKNPGAVEVVGNDVDEDCDGIAQGGDDPDPNATKPETAACTCDAGGSPVGRLGWIGWVVGVAAVRRRRS